MNHIAAVSYSRINVHEECNYRAYLAFVKKIKELPSPALENGKEHPMDRGSRVHKTAEDFVRGASMPCVEMETFLTEFKKLNQIYIENNESIHLETMWCFKADWTPTVWNDWDNIWLRIKTDLTLFLDPTTAVVVDYKTGKMWGNEVKHTEQAQLYAIGAFMMFPALETVHVELWYLDQDGLMGQTYTRAVAMKYFKKWSERMDKVTDDRDFKANPNQHSCRYCPFKTGPVGKFGQQGTGDCERNP